MDAVKSFNAELSSLYEVKPPISKAKMTAITRGAIKAIKFYKHVVQSVEKFILKCKPEYKVPGLYVIDSIVRQSRHQFGADKDVFAPRFAKNMRQTFINLFVCPAEDKSKIIRVLNLWQKNQVFAPDVIQPLFDLADPNNPIHKELGTPLQSNGMNSSAVKGSPALQKTPTKGSQQGVDGAHLGGANLNLTDPNILIQLQQLQRLLARSGDSSSKSESQVHFDKKLLDFDYGDDDDEAHSSPKPAPALPPPADSVSSLLTNPEVLRQLQTIQQTMTAGQSELDIDKLRKLQEMKQQEEEFDKHLAQTVPNLPFAAECEFKPGTNSSLLGGSYYLPPTTDLSQPPPGYKPQQPYEIGQQMSADNDVQFVGGDNDNGADVEVITLDHGDSRSPSPAEDRYSRRRRSRSRERSRERRDRDRRSRRSRSRSKSRRHRSRSRDKNRAVKEKETEKDKERKKRGLPAIKKENLSVCSTTLWVGHLSKLVHQEDLSNTFGEFGDIVSIDLIPPRGCAFIVMHRRQDAARCLTKLKNHMLNGKAITLAWAPGKGVKGKDLKDYWEGDLGVSYIPWSKLKPDVDIEMLEDGGMIDEDTMPAWMKAKAAAGDMKQPALPSVADGGTTVDTSQPPPVPGQGLLQPPPPMTLPLVSPFHQFGNRLIGIPNLPVPIGVPPPNIMGLGSPFQGQLMQQQNPAPSEASIKSLSESLMSLAQQPFDMMPPHPPMGLPTPHDDNMDVEMEDAEKQPPERPMLLSEQLQQMAQFGGHRDDMMRDDRRDKRDRDRNSHSRDRNRDRDRGRGMPRDPYPDRDRKDDRRDRPNRWGDRDIDHEPIDRREREKTLNDRLQQMAMPNDAPYPNHHHDRVEPPPEMMDRRIYDPDIDEMYRRGGPPPPEDYDLGMNGPPPPEIIDDYPPPMMDEWMPPRMHDYEQERFGRGGRRDFRDSFEPRGGRGGPQDFYQPPPPREGFGPRGGGMMRGGPEFAPPRGPGMRGAGHKFHPRGPPPMRGPRPNAPWKDRPNFGPGPRFEHPDFHRGPPGPPGMYDEPPHMRHRGRFDDRRRQRQDFHDNVPETERFQKRSRWGDSHEEESVPAEGGEEPKGGSTPLHDEPAKAEEPAAPPPEEKVENEVKNEEVAE